MKFFDKYWKEIQNGDNIQFGNLKVELVNLSNLKYRLSQLKWNDYQAYVYSDYISTKDDNYAEELRNCKII